MSVIAIKVLKDIESPKGLPKIKAGAEIKVASDYGEALIANGYAEKVVPKKEVKSFPVPEAMKKGK